MKVSFVILEATEAQSGGRTPFRAAWQGNEAGAGQHGMRG